MFVKRLCTTVLILALVACGDDAGPKSQSGQASAKPEAQDPLAPTAAENTLSEQHDVISSWTGDLDTMHKRRRIRILTVYSVGRYYMDGATEKGLVSEAARLFEDFINKRFGRKHARVNVVVVPVARNQLIPALRTGRGDIIVASLSITDERRKLVDFSIPSARPVSEILVTGPSAPSLDSIDDLSGETVRVRQSSSYRESLEALNRRLQNEGKPPVRIKFVSELLEDDDLVEMVNADLLHWAIIDDYKVSWWEDVFTNLTVRDDIVLRSGGLIAWGMRKNSPLLESAVNDFLRKNREGTLIGNILKNRYFRDFDWASNALSAKAVGRFSELEPIFRKYGDLYGIDHYMIAAQGYQESRLDQRARSSAGAIGIMQIKASTAGDRNINIKGIHEVDANIHAGVKYLAFLRDRYFSEPGISERDQILLALAAYNVGPSRMINLRNKTRKMGYDPNIWFDNVELAAARDVGREPVQYVSNIFKYHLAYMLSEEQISQRESIRERAGILGI